MTAPDISILLPTKDRPDRLERALKAILSQEGPTFEVIVDNGGETVAFDDPRVVVINRPGDLWGGANYNNMSSHASGRLMHISADDDIMLPGTLADAFVVEAEWSYSPVWLVEGVCGWVYEPGPWDAERLQYSNFVPLPSVFWTRGLLDRVGGFDESLTFVADYELWARFGARSTPQLRAHVAYLYERWSGAVSSTHGDEIDAEVERLHERWRAIGFGNR